MKDKPRVDRILDVLVILLVLLALALVVASTYQFNDTKAVYRGF